MPNLPSRSTSSRFLLFKGRIPHRDLVLKLDGVAHLAKVDWLRCGEDGGLLRKVPVMWVVQRILDEVPHEHFDLRGRLLGTLQLVRGDASVVDMAGLGGISEGDGVVVDFDGAFAGLFVRAVGGGECAAEAY